MSSVSASGVCMLIFLIVVGPIIYGVKHLYEKIHGKLSSHEMVTTDDGQEDDGQEEEDNGQEDLSSKAYLFALIGYAIGIGKCMGIVCYYWIYLYEHIHLVQVLDCCSHDMCIAYCKTISSLTLYISLYTDHKHR